MTKTNDKPLTVAAIKKAFRALALQAHQIDLQKAELTKALERLTKQKEKAKGWRMIRVTQLRKGMKLFTAGKFVEIVSLHQGGYRFSGRNEKLNGYQRVVGLANGKYRTLPMAGNVKVAA